MEGRRFINSPSARSVRSVSTISEIEEMPPLPATPPQEKVYVAVKLEAKEGKSNLLWAIEYAGRDRTIVLTHVLQPAKKIPTLLGKLPVDAVSAEEVKAYRKLERDKAYKNLNEYVTICAQQKVRAEKVLIDNIDIADGLVELITQHQITILVMGAAADKHYSKKLKHLRSKTAIGVNQQADPSCHILFVCKGHLIFSREASSDAFQIAQSPTLSSRSPSNQQSRALSTRQNELIMSEGNPVREITKYYSFGPQGNVVMPDAATQSRLSVQGSPHDIWEGITKSWISDRLSSPIDEILDDIGTLPLPKDEESEIGSIQLHSVQESEEDLRLASPYHEEDSDLDSNVYIKLQEALKEAESLKNEAYDEYCRRRKAEVDALIAMRKAKASETQYYQEVKQRRQIEETLAREKLEVQKLKEQHDKISEQLNKAMAQKLELEHRISESDHIAKDFEDKLSKARSLLHSLQLDFDALQQERDAAVKEAEGLRQRGDKMVAGTSGDLSSEFSFMELEQATENFSQSLMIGEGGFGSVYKGFLRNTMVAIKMLHPRSLQGQSEFDQEVSVLSRVRHPNLVTLIGACREASALIYEFLPNGSLEDRLSCLNDSAPLTWQVRTRIILEVCSALIFLHSNKPHPVVHGDLKPDNILLDANFVSKLGDFGICRFLVPSKTSTTLCRNTHPKGTFAYIDPEFLTTGEITPHSDIYSFGIIILRLLTGKSALAIAREVQNALDNEYLHAILDPSAGDWPFIQAKQLAHLGLRCSEMGRKNRPTLSEAWRIVEPLTKAASLSSSPASFRSLSDDNIRIPSYFICPIFQEIMRDPQIAGDGFTYEAEAIRGWIDGGHDTSPMTNLKLPHCNLIPNRALRSAIQEWYQQHQS